MEQFWNGLKCWWEESYDEILDISEKNIILGFYMNNNYTLNNVILTAKYFIHVQKCKNRTIYFRHFQAFLKSKIQMESCILTRQKKTTFLKKDGNE